MKQLKPRIVTFELRSFKALFRKFVSFIKQPEMDYRVRLDRFCVVLSLFCALANASFVYRDFNETDGIHVSAEMASVAQYHGFNLPPINLYHSLMVLPVPPAASTIP